MLSLNADLQRTCKKFLGRVKETFSLEKLSTALEDFYNLTFADFVKELSKQKIKLSLKDKDEWEEYFGEYKASCQTLAAHIAETDQSINALVYRLYGLSAEEVEIIEHSSK